MNELKNKNKEQTERGKTNKQGKNDWTKKKRKKERKN